MFMMSFVALQCPFTCGYNCHSGGFGVAGSGMDAELWKEQGAGLCQCCCLVHTCSSVSF